MGMIHETIAAQTFGIPPKTHPKPWGCMSVCVCVFRTLKQAVPDTEGGWFERGVLT